MGFEIWKPEKLVIKFVWPYTYLDLLFSYTNYTHNIVYNKALICKRPV